MHRIQMLVIILLFGTVAAADGDAIHAVYVTFDDGDYNLVVIDLMTNETVQALSSPEYECPVQMSPDGERVLYTVGDTQRQGRVLEVASGAIHEIPITNGRWSMDSRRIAEAAYIYDVEDDTVTEVVAEAAIALTQWHGSDLYIVVHEDDQLRVNVWDGDSLTALERDYALPAGSRYSVSMSPDAQTLLVGVRGESDREWVYDWLDLATGDVRQLQIAPVAVAWHPDGARFAFQDDNNAIRLYDLASESAQTLVESNYHLLNIQWSPSGAYLSFSTSIPGGTFAPSYTMSVLHLATGEVIPFAHRVSLNSGEMQWVSDKDIIYSRSESEVHPDEAHSDLYHYDVLSRTNRQITGTPTVDERLACIRG